MSAHISEENRINFGKTLVYMKGFYAYAQL